MTLAQLRTFCAVATLNSFSRAAEKLHLTQPAVSAQVVALEDALKVKLFDRVGKKISLSESGRVALAAAEEILGRVARLQTELIDLRELRAGRVAIGASQVVGSYLLPELLARFRGLHPGVEIDVRVEPARRVIEEHKRASRDRLAKLCADANLKQPELLADELFLLLEGARVCSQSIGTDSPCCRFVKMGETIVASHEN